MCDKIKKKSQKVKIIGAGLAGSEAAYQLAKRGVSVVLYEMRPKYLTPAHKTRYPAELVCSNSLGSDSSHTAPGLLKGEMRKLDSLIIDCADNSRVPAGQALAVDRVKFSSLVQGRLESFDNIEFVKEKVDRIPRDAVVVVATGPLTAEALADDLKKVVGQDYLYFFDAVSPIVLTDSINREKVFQASRYDKGTPDYLNCPMTEQEYDAFYHELINAERITPADFEKDLLFSGCMPIEEMADKGKKTPLFGPLKPVGLKDGAAAVVQLRKENAGATMYSLVGFQTRLKWSEQKRVFRMIPGLEKAEFIRFGVMHKNLYINAPKTLNATLRLKADPCIFPAGQITGVEGYVESAAMGLLAGIYISHLFEKGEINPVPRDTALGSLTDYLADSPTKDFQPMNINFGILPSANVKAPKRERRKIVINRALKSLDRWVLNEME